MVIPIKTAKFHEYTITEKGQVFGRTGSLRKPILKNGRYDMRFNTPNGKITYPLARVVYAAFNLDFDITDKNQCITFKDNNKLNIHLDNLICKFRGDLIQGEGHRNRIAITDQQVEQIRKEYQKTIDNRPINQHDKKEIYNSYRSLAKKYNVTYGLIKQIIDGKTRNKSEYKLKKSYNSRMSGVPEI